MRACRLGLMNQYLKYWCSPGYPSYPSNTLPAAAAAAAAAAAVLSLTSMIHISEHPSLSLGIKSCQNAHYLKWHLRDVYVQSV